MEEGEMTSIDTTEPSRARRTREEAQTMAEYGVVLTVITLAIVTSYALFSAKIEGAIYRAIGLIPG
jgi:Flp pilus assembly pilin Flp